MPNYYKKLNDGTFKQMDFKELLKETGFNESLLHDDWNHVTLTPDVISKNLHSYINDIGLLTVSIATTQQKIEELATTISQLESKRGLSKPDRDSRDEILRTNWEQKYHLEDECKAKRSKATKYANNHEKLDEINKKIMHEILIVPTADELYGEFINKFEKHPTGLKKLLAELLREMANINKETIMDDDGKIRTYLELILKAYNKLSLTTGKPLFSQPTDRLKKDLQAFCKKEFGIDLPDKLEKNQSLDISMPPLDKTPIGKFIAWRDTYGPEFTYEG